MKLEDKLVRLGRGEHKEGRLVNLPIEQGSTRLFHKLDAFDKAKSDRYSHGTAYYGRYGTDSSFELERAIADLEGAEGCVSTSSGVAAVTMAILGATSSGGHLLVADNIYEPTRGFCDTLLTRFGVESTYFDPMSPIDDLIKDNTQAVIFEAPGSGTFEVPSIRSIAQTARNRGVTSIIDATWATPINCRPLEHGIDVVVHSGSKYLSGHSDVMIGFIACNAATFDQMRRTCLALGERPGGQDVFLTLRGLRTLGMRMKAAEDAGLEMAAWFAEQPQVLKVLHPAFPDCPGHANWRAEFSGASSLFSIIVKDCTNAQIHDFVDALECFGVGVSWGGYESLVLPVKPHRTASAWTEQGQVIRFAIGFENLDTLKADLAAAFPILD